MPSFSQFILFLPAAICLFWLAFHSMGNRHSETFHLMALQLVNLIIYHLFPLEPLIYLSGAAILPLSIMFLERLRTGRIPHYYSLLWIIIPVTLFTAGVTTGILSRYHGQDMAHERHILDLAYWWTLVAEAGILILYLIIVVFRLHNKPLVHTFRFLFGKGPATPLELQLSISILSVPTVALTYIPYFEQYMPYLSVLMAVILFFFGYAGLFCGAKTLTRAQAGRLLRYNFSDAGKGDFVEAQIGDLVDEAETEALRRIQEHISENLHLDNWQSDIATQPTLASSLFQSVAQSWDDDSLLSQFQRLMIDQQLFLQPSLTLEDVAKRMGTNKTYVSKLVNNTYNQGFPELLNTLRIDYAEQYLLNHREAKQKDVAAACGFLSASAFNSTFKKVTGLTPKMWVNSYSLQALRAYPERRPEGDE